MTARVEGGFHAMTQLAGQRAEARAASKRENIVRAAEGLGISAREEGDTVVMEGRGLLARWLRDARIRNIGRDA